MVPGLEQVNRADDFTQALLVPADIIDIARQKCTAAIAAQKQT
jgi:hypothetical protein